MSYYDTCSSLPHFRCTIWGWYSVKNNLKQLPSTQIPLNSPNSYGSRSTVQISPSPSDVCRKSRPLVIQSSLYQSRPRPLRLSSQPFLKLLWDYLLPGKYIFGCTIILDPNIYLMIKVHDVPPVESFVFVTSRYMWSCRCIGFSIKTCPTPTHHIHIHSTHTLTNIN